jgi:RNA polymerase sigma-70 factor (sigma-E family)
MQIGRTPVSGNLDEEFTHFVAARMGTMRRVAYLLCQDWQRADDLVQAAITRLYVRWDRVRGMEHTEAYARTILVREYLSEQRSGWARRVSLNVPVPDTAGRDPDTETILDMRAALAGLPARQRATLVLRFYCDLNVDQTAELLGCSAGTVKSQTAKGIDALRGRLAPARDTQAGRDTLAAQDGQAHGPLLSRPASVDDHARYAAREVTDHG